MSTAIRNLLTVITLTFLSISAAAQNASDTNRKDIEAIIERYLLENPEVIEKAIIELQRRRQQAQVLPAVNLYRSFLENDPEAPVLGNPDGDVTIVEFFDYRCGVCRSHFPEMLKLVRDDGNIRYIPRQFPILDKEGEKPVSRLAAYAALAAHKQGKFKEYHAALLTSKNSLTEESLYEIAAKVGLNIEKLKTDMRDKLIEKSVRNTRSIGIDIGLSGTPAYIVGNDVMSGAPGYEGMKEIIARARREAKEKPAE